jgi:hypothetical protein
VQKALVKRGIPSADTIDLLSVIKKIQLALDFSKGAVYIP